MRQKAVEWFQQDTVFVTPHCTQTNLELTPNKNKAQEIAQKQGM